MSSDKNPFRNIPIAKLLALCAILAVVLYLSWQVEFTREFVMVLAASAFSLALSAVFAILIIYNIARNSWQLTFVPTGEIKFVKFGETIVRPLINVDHIRYDSKSDTIETIPDSPMPDKGKTRIGRALEWLARHIPDFDRSKQGIYWVSILYPIKSVHTWSFAWPKLEAKTHKEDTDKKVLEEYVIVAKEAEVSSLYYEYAYPILTDEIELKGNFTIKLVVRVILTVRRPVYLIGYLKGKFMPQLISEISGRLDNCISKMRKADGSEFGIDEFRNADKEEMVEKILKEGDLLLDGSFAIKESSYVSFSYTAASQRLIDAITAQEEQARLGDARIMTERKNADAEAEISRGKKIRAEADLEVKKREAEGDAYEMKIHLEAIGSHPLGGQIEIAQIEKDRATAVAQANVEAARELRQFQGKALVIGSGSSGVMLSVDDGNVSKKGKKGQKGRKDEEEENEEGEE